MTTDSLSAITYRVPNPNIRLPRCLSPTIASSIIAGPLLLATPSHLPICWHLAESPNVLQIQVALLTILKTYSSFTCRVDLLSTPPRPTSSSLSHGRHQEYLLVSTPVCEQQQQQNQRHHVFRLGRRNSPKCTLHTGSGSGYEGLVSLFRGKVKLQNLPLQKNRRMAEKLINLIHPLIIGTQKNWPTRPGTTSASSWAIWTRKASRPWASTSRPRTRRCS